MVPKKHLCSLQKGRGDVKKKGKVDPYAYVPLEKAQLNRRYEMMSVFMHLFFKYLFFYHNLNFIHRKKAKLQGQFKGMVRGAKKGALSGKRTLQKKKKA